MNRRGILGMLAAAPVAGPAIAKEAAGTMAYSGPAAGGLVNYASQVEMVSGKKFMEPDAAIRKAFRLGLISRETVSKIIAESGLGEGGNTYLHNLDPDLQAVKSFSMSARFRMQRDRARARSLERFLQPPQNMWEFGRELLAKGIVSGDDA